MSLLKINKENHERIIHPLKSLKTALNSLHCKTKQLAKVVFLTVHQLQQVGWVESCRICYSIKGFKKIVHLLIPSWELIQHFEIVFVENWLNVLKDQKVLYDTLLIPRLGRHIHKKPSAKNIVFITAHLFQMRALVCPRNTLDSLIQDVLYLAAYSLKFSKRVKKQTFQQNDLLKTTSTALKIYGFIFSILQKTLFKNDYTMHLLIASNICHLTSGLIDIARFIIRNNAKNAIKSSNSSDFILNHS